MLRINLLPPYIFERRKVRQTAILFGVLLILVLGGMVGWIYALGKREAQLQTDVAAEKVLAAQVEAIQQSVKAEQAKIPPIKERVDYINAVMAYNVKLPALYEELTKYTYERILYRSVQPSNTQLQIAAHARSVGDCGRYLLNMYRAGHLFSAVTVSAVPGYPAGADASPGAGFDFTVTCTLVEPITAPNYGPGATSGPGSSGTTNNFAPPVGGGPPSTTPMTKPIETPPPGG